MLQIQPNMPLKMETETVYLKFDDTVFREMGDALEDSSETGMREGSYVRLYNILKNARDSSIEQWRQVIRATNVKTNMMKDHCNELCTKLAEMECKLLARDREILQLGTQLARANAKEFVRNPETMRMIKADGKTANNLRKRKLLLD